MKEYLILLLFSCLFISCIGGGTHGYIKRYRYDTSKYELENIVHNVIVTNLAIHQDSVKGYYNNDINYISFRITYENMPYAYTIHYYGNKTYWDTSKTSAISIVYAHDAEGKGGSAGNGGIKLFQFRKKKRLIEPFEKEFILKVDNMLNIKHIEE
jgi:hypothetical protein